MDNTKFAQWFYSISIVVLVITALGIVWRLIILPPDLSKLDVVGLTSAVLGIAATVLAILGAVAVATWWASLDKQVTKRVKKLYDKQRVDIDQILNTQRQQLEINIENSQTQINNLTQFKDDIEEILVESFVSMGPLFSEAAARKAVSMGRLLRFPYAMTMTYFQLLKPEIPKEQNGIHNEINSFEQQKTYIHLDTNPKATLEAQRDILLKIIQRTSDQRLMLASNTREYWERASYWFEHTLLNKTKIPALTEEDIHALKEQWNLYRAYIEGMDQNLNELKENVNDMVITIETHLHQSDTQRTP